MLFVVILALPLITIASDLPHESHHCTAVNPDSMTCLSLDASDVAVLTEATATDRTSQSWGPLTRRYGRYYKSASERFSMEHDLISAEMQVDGQPSILLAAVEHKSPKSLADLTSIFSMNQPNCTIELSPLKPYSARVHWNGHIYSGTVSKEYPYTITWANGEGVGLLLELPEWYNVLKPESSNPYFILAEYRPTGGTPQRVLMRHAGKYWTDDRLRRWVEDVNKHEPYPV